MPARKRGRGGTRSRGGRQPLPLDAKQRNRVTVHLTDAEYEALCKRAGDEPLGSAARRLLLRALGRKW